MRNESYYIIHPYRRAYYRALGELSSEFEEFLAARSQFDSDHDQIWLACADGYYLNKLAPWMAPWKGSLIGAILRSET